MKCAYCGNDAKGTREHIISCAILDLFPECFITFDSTRETIYEADPVIKDVCLDCNNKKLSYIDSYAKRFVEKYFVKKYSEDESLKIEYDYVMIQKMLLKYAYNDMRSHKQDCSFFDNNIIDFLLNDKDVEPKKNISVLCGLAVNVSPLAESMYGNLKLRWCKNPIFMSNTMISHIDYNTGQIFLNKDVDVEKFADLEFSYLFKFNSVQFIIMCWRNGSDKIEQNNVILKCQYPYHLMSENETTAIIPQCTNEINYHHFEHIHVRWDGLFEVGRMRKLSCGGLYQEKEELENEWLKFENDLKNKHPR